MALKNNWNDLVDGESFVEVEPINRMAHAIIANEENILSVQELGESIQADNESQEARINELSEDLIRLENNSARLDSKTNENEKRITNLEKGIPSDLFLTDSSIAYSKTVPQNALPYAEVKNIGGVTRKCTNLIPYPYYETTTTKGGVTFTDKGDGGVAINGTATGTLAFYLCKMPNDPLPIGYYSVEANGVCEIRCYHDGGTATTFETSGGAINITKPIIQIALLIREGRTYNGTVYPMLNKGSTALPYEPYFEGLRSAPVTEVESVGVNLFDPSPIGIKTFIGLTYTTEDGCVKINGAKVSGANVHIMTAPNMTLPAGTYTVSVRMVSGTVSGIEANGGVFFGINQSTYGQRTTPGVSKVGDVGVRTFTLSEPTLITSFDIAPDYGSVGAVFDNAVFACQFEQADAATEFKPYTRNTLPIPEAVRPKHGINESVYDYIDLDKKQSVKRVGAVDMGTLNWYTQNGILMADGTQLGYKYGVNGICSKYELANSKGIDQSIYMFDSYYGNNRIVVWDSAYTDAATFKAAMSGVMLYYELATPVVTDISDLLLEDNFICVEGNGTITMINQYKYNVPSEIVFMLNEV